MRSAIAVLVAALVLTGLTGCTEDLPDDPAPTETTPPPTVSPPDEPPDQPSEQPTDEPTDEPTEEPEALPPVNRPLSLPALMREEPSGGDVEVLRTELENDAYTRQQVEYRSGDRTVSGVLLRPRGRGPFPAVVLNHGYIEPSIYVTGQGLAREQDALARAGFVVLHTDYSGHATSDPVRPLERETRLAYTRDSANAVKALETLRYVDAAISWSSVSSDLAENIRHFTEPGRPEAANALYERLGTPEEAPEVYAELAARTYFDRITEPVLVHHATTDETCPFVWARDTERLMKRAGVDSRLFVYEGEAHAFGPQWQLAMDRTIRFLREHLSR